MTATQSEDNRSPRPALPLVVVERLEDIAHYLVLAMILILAAVVLYNTAYDLATGGGRVAVLVTDAVNGLLFVVILMELLKTVAAHFDGTGFQLEPFLIIGMISAVRHILTVGARLTLIGEGTSESFSRSQNELAVNAAVVLGLAVALILVRLRPRSWTNSDDQ